MQTRLVQIDGQEQEALLQAQEVLQREAVLAIPTETVYGLAVLHGNPAAEARLRQLKQREAQKPFQILIGSSDQVERLGVVRTERLVRLLARFWPGPLTVVVSTTSGERLGLRMPDHAFVRALAERCGPLTASSANEAGEPAPVNAEEVLAAFRGKIELVLDGGPAVIGQASTVVAVSGDQLEILRAGAVSRERLDDCWEEAERCR